MKSFIEIAPIVVVVLTAVTISTVAGYDDPVTGECGKDWELQPPDSFELNMAAQYAAHVHSQKTGQEYKDVLVKVIEGYIKPCRWPKYNFTATYATSNCKVGDFVTEDCPPQLDKGLYECKSFLWVPPGRGGQLVSHACRNL